MLLNNHVQSLWREQTATATGDTQDGTVSTSSRSAPVSVAGSFFLVLRLTVGACCNIAADL